MTKELTNILAVLAQISVKGDDVYRMAMALNNINELIRIEQEKEKED